MPLSFGFEPEDLVIVTGAGSGIGRATAMLCAEAGLEVAIWDIDADSAGETAALVGGTATRVDVTSEADVARGLAALDRPARFLVNNAGPPSAVPTPFATGLVNGVGSVQLVSTAWLESGPPEGGALVNVASVAGNELGAEPAWYGATKSAIAGYTRHLAVALAGRIRANAVAPGMIATPRSAAFARSDNLQRALTRIPAGRMGQPEEVGWIILSLLSPRAGYTNGALVVVDGGWTVTG